MVWTSIEGNLRQRPPLHLSLWTRVSQQNRRQTESVDRLPPPNRRAFGTKEPMGGTIPAPCREHSARRLEPMAHCGLRSTQRSRQCYTGNHSERGLVGVPAYPPS